MAIYSNIQKEYELTGMVSQSFELANKSVIPALREDRAIFQQAIQELRGEGHFRVPYIFTEAIASVAYDKTLVSVIQAILGENTPWVVWGPNIQKGTPNEGEIWHVDLESWHWPTITVMVGLENCTNDNATRCIPYSHEFDVLPWSLTDASDDEKVIRAAESLDQRCSSIVSFENFEPGRFYAFDAKMWHCGSALSGLLGREMLILHYQRADDPRIPYMYDYKKRVWFDRPAVYLEGPDPNDQTREAEPSLMSSLTSKKFRTDLHPLPNSHSFNNIIEKLVASSQLRSQKSLVSVVIICFNDEKFLSEAIASVIAQTYNNWELLLVDDGSKDRSASIMEDYVAQHPERIRYLEHKNHRNRGKNASRNLGINNARGEYIALLDSDDVWLPHKLEQQVAILEHYPQAGMVYGLTSEWYSWTKKEEDLERDQPSRFSLGVGINTLVDPPKLLMLMLEGTIYIPTPSNIVLRKEVFTQVGLFNEKFHDVFEDQDFLAKVFLNVPVFASDEIWSKYRQSPDSSIGQYDAAVAKNANIWYKKRLYFLKSVRKYLSQQQVKYPEVGDYLDELISSFRTKQRQLRLKPFTGLWLKLWLRFLDLIMQIGRSLLPLTVRDWLWKTFGRRLHP